MFNNVALDVSIGLVFIFLLYSLLVTIIGEMVATWLGVRARILRIAIERMLNDGYYVKSEKVKHKMFKGWLRRVLLYEPDEFKTSLAGRFYEYPSIKYLGRIEQAHRGLFSLTKPSYFTAENFADTIINLLKEKGDGNTDMDRIQFCLKFNTLDIEPKTLKQLRNTFLSAQNDFQQYKLNLMKWFNETMDRANGWYKRKLQFILFWLGFVVAICFNVDSISLTIKLSKDKQAREQLVQMGIQSAEAGSTVSKIIENIGDTSLTHDTIWAESYRQIKLAERDANKIMGLGWDQTKPEKLSLFNRSFYYYRQANPFRKEFWGLIITGLAISLGAPFWFDLLKKLVSLRGSGVKPEEKKPDTNTFQEPDQTGTELKEVAFVKAEPLDDLADEALETFGPSIRNIPGVKSVFTVIRNGIKTVQVNVDSALTGNIISTQFPELLVHGKLIPQKIVVSGTPLSNIGEKGTILNKSRNNGFGSLGCMLRRTDTGSLHILSCWHVMKSDISYSDSDSETTIIDFKGQDYADRWAGGIQGAYDYAIARCLQPDGENFNEFLKAKLDIHGVIKPGVVNRRDVDEQVDVKFYDCLSDTTRKGFIYAEADTVDIHYLDRTRRIRDVLLLTNDREEAISRAGNSGAIVFDNNNKAIAMIISGDMHYTYAVKLSHIFQIHNEMTIA